MLPAALNWLLLSYSALVLAGGWAYSTLHIRSDREHTLQAERDRLLTVASAVDTGAAAMLNDGVGAAVAGAQELESFGESDGHSAALVRSTLQKMLTGGQYVRSVFLVGTHRYARAGRSDFESAGEAPSWFTAAGTAGVRGTWVGGPIPDPEQPRLIVIPFARRVQLADHRWVWAGSLLDFRAHDALYAQLQGSSSAVALLSDEGMLLTYIPDSNQPMIPVGTQLSGSPLFQSVPPTSSSGVVQGVAPRYGKEVLFAYHRLSDYPLIVAIGETLDQLLAGWRERRHTALVVTAGSSALLLLMTGLLDKALRGLRRRELHYRTLFNSATFSVFLLEGDRFVAANDTVRRMFGLGTADTAIGLTPWALSPEHQPDGRGSEEAARARIETALREGGSTFEWLHRRRNTGENFPAQVDLSTLKAGRTTLALAVVHDLTEAKRAEQQRKESEQRYRALVDALPEAVYVHRGGELLFVNQAAVGLMHASTPEDLLGKQVLSFAREGDRNALAKRTRDILETGTAEPQEVQVTRLDGSLMWAELQGVRIQFAGGSAVQSVLRDITARKAREQADAERAERFQRQSTALLRLAALTVSGVPDLEQALRMVCRIAGEVLRAERTGIWLLDPESATLRCAECYDVLEQRLIDVSALSERNVTLYLDALRDERVIESADPSNDVRLRGLTQPSGALPPPASLIAAAIRSSGELTGVLAFEQVHSRRSWQADEVSFAAGVADQIAQLLIAAKREELLLELRGLAGELIRVQDEERRRIGRDLHDSIGQTLTALELDLARLAEAAPRLAADQGTRVANCVKLASQCAAEIRSASYLLHPPLLDELGLVSALHWLADGLRERSRMDIRLELPDIPSRLQPEEELTLFRVAQEALTNVLRHAGSPWVAIRLKADAHWIRLEIEDAGRGMGPRRSRVAPGSHASVGLTGMRERIRQIGGTLQMESTSGGTLVVATLRPHQRIASVGSGM